jgi:hypothetical protein
MIFERKVLKKIFGPTKELNGLWRFGWTDPTKIHNKIY